VAKNLLNQIMIKDTKKKKRNSEEDENLVEGLAHCYKRWLSY
jgi:hypothetical protein